MVFSSMPGMRSVPLVPSSFCGSGSNQRGAAKYQLFGTDPFGSKRQKLLVTFLSIWKFRTLPKYQNRSRTSGPPCTRFMSYIIEMPSVDVTPRAWTSCERLSRPSRCRLSWLPPNQSWPLCSLPPSRGTMLMRTPPPEVSALMPLVSYTISWLARWL